MLSKRIIEEAQYIIYTHASNEETAEKFGISVNSLEEDLSHLYDFSYSLYWQLAKLRNLRIPC